MLKTESFAGALRPDKDVGQASRSPCPPSGGIERVAARGPLLADAGRRDGRRPAVPGRLSLRLHRADAQPLPADASSRSRSLLRHEARPEGDPARSAPTSTPRKSATTASGPSSGSGSTATRSSTRPRSTRMVKAGVQRADRHAALPTAAGAGSAASASTRWPHTTAVVVHGLQIAQRERRGPRARRAGARRRVAQALPGRAGRAAARTPPTKTQPVQGARPTTSTRSSTWSSSTPSVDNAAMRDFLYRDRTDLAVYAKAMFGLALHKQKRAATSWR